MDSWEYERRLQELERTNQILQRKLDRTEAALEWLERTNAEKEALLKEIILEFRAAETEALAVRNFSALVLENLPIGLIVTEVTEFKYLLWNLASTQILGYTATEALGKTAYDLFPQEQADLLTNSDRELLTNCHVLTLPRASVCTKQGQAITLQIRKSVLLNDANQPHWILTLIDEVTEPPNGVYEQQQIALSSKAQAPSLPATTLDDLEPSVSEFFPQVANCQIPLGSPA